MVAMSLDLYPTYDVDQVTARAIYSILPCGTANYYRYLAQWSDSDTTLVVLLQLWIQAS